MKLILNSSWFFCIVLLENKVAGLKECSCQANINIFIKGIQTVVIYFC